MTKSSVPFIYFVSRTGCTSARFPGLCKVTEVSSRGKIMESFLPWLMLVLLAGVCQTNSLLLFFPFPELQDICLTSSCSLPWPATQEGYVHACCLCLRRGSQVQPFRRLYADQEDAGHKAQPF